MAIQKLSEQLASQIAAGEVVERPASVVKELVENALDAGATTINIDIRSGGRTAIQVSDNGHGIPAAEVETAFLRHATSKIGAITDLEEIGTLGFRGEALAAIAAVSQVTVVSRTTAEPAGLRLELEGGHVVKRETVGAPSGTVISVENLFFNTPARLKFLKTVSTEKRQIDEFVTKYALAYPHIRFRLTHDGRISLQSPGSGSVRDVLIEIFGADMARDFLEIGEPAPDEEPTLSARLVRPIEVRGFVGPPGMHRANRNQITLFVNGRWVKDKNLTYAIIQAYHTLLPIGRYPIAVLFISLPLNQVDVNVHPMKTEVRFREAGRVFAAVQRAVRERLIADSPIRSLEHSQFHSLTQPSSWRHPATGPAPAFGRREGGLDWEWTDLTSDGPAPGQIGFDLPNRQPLIDLRPRDDSQPPPQPNLAGERLPIMRVVGQISSSYIITEGPEGMFLIDQHAAHERIQYENFMAAHARKEIPAQGLVAGTAVTLSPDQATLLTETLPLLSDLGFTLEPFGPNSFMVRAIPAVVAHQDPLRVLNDILADLERGDTPLQAKIEERIIRRVCKTASIKAGQTLSMAEMESLIQQLEACHSPLTCPHGRPTLIYLSVHQLEKQFGRL